MHISIHQQFNNYKVLKIIGHGTFATVSLIYNLDDQKFYALKIIQITKMSQKQIQYSLNQVRLLQSISIPNVIKYEGAYYHQITGQIGIVMEYANQGDLQQKIRQAIQINHQRGFDEEFIWKTTFQILKGLKKLHQHKIIHRDIKTANIFFVNGVAKLGDLNVSRVLQKQLMCSTLTGTPYYMSPQIWNGEKYDAKCDIWALGCIIYQMCTFFPPFKARDFVTLQRKINLGQYEHISYVYSDRLSSFIDLCLKIQPQDRPDAKKLIETIIFNDDILDKKQNYQQQGIIQLTSPIKIPKKINAHRRVQTQHLEEKNCQQKKTLKKNVRFQEATHIQIQQQNIDENRNNKMYKKCYRKVKKLKSEQKQKDKNIKENEFPEIKRGFQNKNNFRIKTQKSIKLTEPYKYQKNEEISEKMANTKNKQLKQQKLLKQFGQNLKEMSKNNVIKRINNLNNINKSKDKNQFFKIRVRSKSKSLKQSNQNYERD